MPKPPKNIAHRGGAGLRPENTLAAIEHAIDIGCDGIEVDVHLSADGEVVVHHDYRLKPALTRLGRTWLRSPGPLLKEMTISQLKDYDVGRLNPESAYAQKYPNQRAVDGETIPLLREVMYRLNQRDAKTMDLVVEIKYDTDNPQNSAAIEPLADAVVALIAETGFGARASVMSFDWRLCRRVQDVEPSIPTVYLTAPELLDGERDGDGPALWTAGFAPADYGGSPLAAIAAAGGAAWGPYFGQVTEAAMSEARDLGLAVRVWTPNSEQELRSMIDFGVDSITTDRPDHLRRMIRRLF